MRIPFAFWGSFPCHTHLVSRHLSPPLTSPPHCFGFCVIRQCVVVVVVVCLLSPPDVCVYVCVSLSCEFPLDLTAVASAVLPKQKLAQARTQAKPNPSTNHQRRRRFALTL